MDHARAPSGLSNAASDGHFVVADVAAIKPDFTNPVLYSLETRQDVNMDTLDGSSDDESMPEPSVAGDSTDEDGGVLLTGTVNDLRTLPSVGRKQLNGRAVRREKRKKESLEGAIAALRRTHLTQIKEKQKASEGAPQPLKKVRDKQIKKGGKSSKLERKEAIASARLLAEFEKEERLQPRIKKMQGDHPTLNDKQIRCLIKMEDGENEETDKKARKREKKLLARAKGKESSAGGRVLDIATAQNPAEMPIEIAMEADTTTGRNFHNEPTETQERRDLSDSSWNTPWKNANPGDSTVAHNLTSTANHKNHQSDQSMDIETAKALAGYQENSSRKFRAPKYLRDAARDGRTVSEIPPLTHDEFQQARQQWRGA